MRHALQTEGFGVRLRPVRLEDASFIVWLRHLDHAWGKLGDSASDVPSEEAWLENYFNRAGDYYFIAETLSGIPVGTIGIYGLSGASAEAGRLIMRPDVPAGIPSSVMTLDLGFGRIGLREVRSTSVASNVKVHSYVAKLGFHKVRIEPGGRVIHGQPVDIVHFAMTADQWAQNRDRVLPLAKHAEARG